MCFTKQSPLPPVTITVPACFHLWLTLLMSNGESTPLHPRELRRWRAGGPVPLPPPSKTTLALDILRAEGPRHPGYLNWDEPLWCLRLLPGQDVPLHGLAGVGVGQCRQAWLPVVKVLGDAP